MRADNYEQPIEEKLISWTVRIFLFLMAWILILSSFYTINAGERGVMLTFGKVSLDAKGEGLHFKIPLVQSITVMDIKTQKYEASLTAASKDLQDVNTIVAINYHITPEATPEIYRDIGLAYSEKVIYPLEQEINKETTAQFTAVELITKRNEVREKMKAKLTEKLAVRNIIVEEISIIDFKFSESFATSIEAKVTAEQNALKEQNNLEVVKFQAQQKVEAARGEAEAIKIINEELMKSPQYIDYLTIQKWNGVMPLALGSGSLLSITEK